MQYLSVSLYQYRTDRSYVSNKSIPGTRVLEMDPSTQQNGPKTSTRGTRDTANGKVMEVLVLMTVAAL